ncbi:MAG: hypothetical protein LBG80_01150 [Bacteroidales bacterium]|jgi:hypothetical protein|nr:hypothetical protein [Bacteroidales bacterium]
MAKQRKNVVMYGVSGKIGDILIFSQRNGKTIISRVPRIKRVRLSKKQKEHQKRFQKATIFAKTIIHTEEGQVYIKAAKEKTGLTAYNIAIADFMHAPEIKSINISAYKGKIGNKIRIKAIDDFAVKSVHVRINNAEGSIIEEGNAVKSAKDSWIYTAVKNNTTLKGNKIIITVSDIPGNCTTAEENL